MESENSIAEQEVEVADATLETQGSVADTTTTASESNGEQVDWQAEITNLKSTLEETKNSLVSKYEKDISALKSSLQSRQAQEAKKWEQEKRTLEEQLRSYRIKEMPEDERTAYQKTIERERWDERERMVAEREARAQELEAMYNYRTMFTSVGIPAEKFMAAQTVEEVANMGWQSMVETINGLRAELETLKSGGAKPETKKPAIKAPEVVKTNGAPPVGTTFESLVKKYGKGDTYRFYEELDSNRNPKLAAEYNEFIKSQANK